MDTYTNAKYEKSTVDINFLMDNQILLISINMRPCINHLSLSADIRGTERNQVLTYNSGVLVS